MAALEFVTLLAIGKQRIIVTWGWTATIVGWATGARTRAWVDALRQVSLSRYEDKCLVMLTRLVE